jgi:NAD+ synthase (glutamine-hydrolysing)
LQGADVIFNLSASNALTGKHTYVRELVAQQSARCLCGYVYASCGFGESTTDVVFASNALIYENGTPLAFAERFSAEAQLVSAEIDVERLRAERLINTTFRADSAYETVDPYELIESGQPVLPIPHLERFVSPTPFVPRGSRLDENCQEIFNIQVMGLATRIKNAHAQSAFPAG